MGTNSFEITPLYNDEKSERLVFTPKKDKFQMRGVF